MSPNVDTATIELRLDNRPCLLPAGTTLADLVARLGHPAHEVGTALNGSFVPRGRRDGCVLHTGDAVVLFQPIVGG